MMRKRCIFVILLGGLMLTAPGQAAPESEFPAKGRPITLIVPNAPGGINDLTARMIVPFMEKELGTPVQVVNKPGGTTQMGTTEAALAKPDGYTLLVHSLPEMDLIYLDPERQAVPQIKELKPVALNNLDIGAIIVRTDSPYKTLKELVDAAKVNPNTLKTATGGLMGTDHMATLYFEKITGVKLRPVHFDGGGPATTALAGGHVDMRVGKVGSAYAQIRSGTVRLLAVMNAERSKFAPEVPTMIELGYPNSNWLVACGVLAPKDTPNKIIDKLGKAIRVATETDEAKVRLDNMGFLAKYMDTKEFASLWKEFDTIVAPLVADARKP
jgi:tripartite-type tricarboxylate transporter receptor subunit TctC